MISPPEETIDLTPNYAGVYALVKSQRWFRAQDIIAQFKASTYAQQDDMFQFFNFLELGINAALGAHTQGDGGAALMDLRDHLVRFTEALTEARHEASWTCPQCGRIYEELELDEQSPKNPSGHGCVSDDCPGQEK